MLVKINENVPNFDRLINIVSSGPANMVKTDYERHKHNYDQLRMKIGYCCVFDGDHQPLPAYNALQTGTNTFVFFLYPYEAPEKNLVESYLASNPNDQMRNFIDHEDHHGAYDKMVEFGLAADKSDARSICWNNFLNTAEYTQLFSDFEIFIINTVAHFSRLQD